MRQCRLLAVSFSAFVLGGCGHAPSLNVFGAFFPDWLFCLAGGLFAVLPVRAAFIKTGLDQRIGPLIVLYPTLMALFSMIFWLLFF